MSQREGLSVQIQLLRSALLLIPIPMCYYSGLQLPPKFVVAKTTAMESTAIFAIFRLILKQREQTQTVIRFMAVMDRALIAQPIFLQQTAMQT